MMKSLTLTPILETGDDKEYPISKSSDYEAWCSSIKCAGDKYQVVLVKKPNVKSRAFNCPDCGSALYWKRKEVNNVNT